jgi:multiple sugar transport system substrate-binding protein
MGKKLTLLLVCILTVSLFSACGKKAVEEETGAKASEVVTAEETSTTADEKSLVFAWWGNQLRNERTQTTLDLYTTEYPNVVFDGQFAGWGDYWTKLATAVAGHTMPDIVQMDYSLLRQYVNKGLLTDLTPYIDNGSLDLSTVDAGIVKSGSIDNGVYAVCIGVNAPALLYNKTLLEENNITIEDNMTMDEFIRVSKEVYEKTGYKTNIAYNLGDSFLTYSLRGQGISMYEDGKFGATSAADFIPFFKFYEQGIEEGWHLTPEVFAESKKASVEQDPLVYGSSPDVRSWSTMIFSNQLTAMQQAAPEGVEIGITTWPSEDPKASNYLKPGQFLSVTNDSKNQEEAVKVVDYFTNSIAANEILLGERGVPASSVVADAISKLMDEKEQLVTEYINKVVTPNCSPIYAPSPEGANEVSVLLDQLEEQLCYGVITAEEAATQLFEEGSKIVESK